WTDEFRRADHADAAKIDQRCSFRRCVAMGQTIQHDDLVPDVKVAAEECRGEASRIGLRADLDQTEGRATHYNHCRKPSVQVIFESSIRGAMAPNYQSVPTTAEADQISLLRATSERTKSDSRATAALAADPQHKTLLCCPHKCNCLESSMLPPESKFSAH